MYEHPAHFPELLPRRNQRKGDHVETFPTRFWLFEFQFHFYLVYHNCPKDTPTLDAIRILPK